jgi:alkanesulfonate monooxygenase SsuD/methylene tetrahydromethanopterin reductase-like flavin-dependent oxidoreductase (luciferase family)
MLSSCERQTDRAPSEMPDYGHDIEFGDFLIPDAGDPGAVLETARLAERLGYDVLAIQDHPY